MSLSIARPVRVARIVPAAKDQSVLELARDEVLELAYLRAGQYCQLSLSSPSIDGYFAAIDPPGTGPLRFLVRAGGPAGDALRKIPPGTTVLVRGPLGEGFPLELAQGRDVFLASLGPGIAAIRAALLGLEATRAHAPGEAPSSIALYHGTRSLEYVPFPSDLETAQRAGVRVTIVTAHEGLSEAIAARMRNAIERDKPVLTNAIAFASGVPALTDALAQVLSAHGLAPEQLHTNF